ncbi:MAG: branched-chain amino acid ABC transporter permease [Acidimicrobiia bacterium]|nr:branched-chain amino acid ABC transporter permease [Acidimicrobiia bacterium]
MIVRECGIYKTDYKADMALYPLPFARWAMAGLGVALVALPFVLPGKYVTWASLVGIAIPGAVGLMLLTGYAGLVSLGHGAFLAVGAYTAAMLATRHGMPFWVCILAGGTMAAIIGLIVGLPSARVKGIYLAIATIAAQFIIEWAINHIDWIAGRAEPTVVLPPPSIFGWELISDTAKYYVILVFAVLSVLAGLNLARSRIGRAFVAIRDREVAANIMGVDVYRYKLLAFALSSFFAGIGGALWAYYLGIANYEMFTITISIEYVAMIIIGGLGSIIGATFGAIFVTLLPFVLSDVLRALEDTLGIGDVPGLVGQLRLIVFGLLIIVFLIAEPEGLNRMWRNIKDYVRVWPFRY